ncbi:Auxin responsive SAUR protein [Corchorus olitorius]|uniref:Auxin responsive SAUR protein n=1 Tax=Corchorus olitorius TaxID=93759 RepID=A0A1R3JB18_9ROSI|nr:Auxin responsive SAUR protein [Corchorus olitorius]
MVCSKIIKLARKWQKMTAMGRKRISAPKTINADCFIIASLTSNKGHFVVYTMDRRRFTMPLSYLSNNIFLQLFKMSEEEFGLSSNEPITLPCDAEFMDYLVCLIQRGLAKNLENVLIDFVRNSYCSLPCGLNQGYASQQLVSGY